MQSASAEDTPKPKKIVLIAGTKSHGPGHHEYELGMRVIKHGLDTSPNAPPVKTEVHRHGWPMDESTLNDADTIVLFCDGSDRDVKAHPILHGDRLATIGKQMKRGCGLVAIHYTVFVPSKRGGPEYLDWIGGYFDYETGNTPNHWFSKIKNAETEAVPVSPEHPISRGLTPFQLSEEYYYNIRFLEGDKRRTSILTTPMPGEPISQTVAWAVERTDGGRGFAFTGGHYHSNWAVENYRRMILNAVLWTAKAEVPDGGVQSQLPGAAPKATDDAKRESAKVLIVTGHQYPGHPWRETTKSIERSLGLDKRLAVDVVVDPEFLAKDELQKYQTVILNYCNWERHGLSDESKQNFVDYLKNGGGLVIVHFANGAFHFSLPKAGDSDWPEFRKICRRVWDHTPGKSAHDAYGKFQVDMTKSKHPITLGMQAYETTDELYFGQQGDEPIEVLATGHSKITGRDEPLAFVYEYGKGRVFQTLLGHDAASTDTPGTAALIRRAAAWTAGLPLKPEPPLVKQAAAPSRLKNHWGREVVGFDWTEEDSRDNRWNDADVGSFLAASYPCPTGPILKGLAIRLGDNQDAAVCYDTGQLAFRAAWLGKFLTFDPARFGLIAPIKFGGEAELLGANAPAWPADQARYVGLYTQGPRTVLEYQIGECRILESPWSETSGDITAFTREFEIAASGKPLRIPICLADGTFDVVAIADQRIAKVTVNDRVIAATVRGHPSAVIQHDQKQLFIEIPAHSEDIRLKLLFSTTSPDQLNALAALARRSWTPLNLLNLTQPGKRSWPVDLVTQGKRAADDRALVVDTLTLPFDNPYRALLFTSGHDFFGSGDAAVCTVHGDVWTVSGIDDQLEKLTWRRYATGLYQPLGLRIVEDQIYVLGRDQITRLHDRNGDGEAEFYECFCNLPKTSSNGHDYSTCLETDPDGNFLFASAAQGIVRVSKDGKSIETVADGLRNPNGLSVSPDGVITASPQEGEWTPATSVIEVRPGGYYGYGGPRASPTRPLGYDPPLCWIPRHVDNSSGGQTWITGLAHPLRGRFFHFSFGRCTMLLGMREVVEDQSQGAVVPLPVQFESGAIRGRFHPRDGHLYVTGLRGWVSSAAQDGCFQRIRYTGRPLHLPTGIQTLANGIKLSFSEPLDPLSAGDPDNFSVEQWNYRWTGEYGSADYKASDPQQEGHDQVEVRSATALEDGRSVFLEIDPLVPVMQMAVQFKLRAADGAAVEHTVYHTINRVGRERIEPAPNPQIVRRGQLDPNTVSRLRPGLLQKTYELRPDDVSSVSRPTRLAALHVLPSQRPASWVYPGSWDVDFLGYLRMDIKDECWFTFEGTGRAYLTVNGAEVTLENSKDTSNRPDGPATVPVTLHKGYNQISLRYQPPAKGPAEFRLLWSSKSFVTEPVPPSVLFHDSGDEELEWSNQWREGRALVASHGCANCHTAEDVVLHKISLPEALRRGPSLVDVSQRLQSDWLAAWIADPKSFRPDATMPQALSGPDRGQQAADVAAYLIAESKGPLPQDDYTADQSLIDRGEQLYESLGCLACHRSSADADSDDRIPLGFVSQKYRSRALQDYLEQPQRHHAGTRMPDFKLSKEEAGSLTAFLIAQSTSQPQPPARAIAGNAERGREIYQAVGCANCHETGMDGVGAKSTASTIAIKDYSRGCLAESAAARRAAPDYAFAPQERRALQLFYRTRRPETLAADPPAEAVARLVKTLRCTACHARDGQPSRLVTLLIDEGTVGLPPENIPHLTWAGEKLRVDWMQKLLAGEREHYSRPWLRARMPAFPAYAQALAVGLAAEHGLPATAEPKHSLDPATVELGRQLTLKDRGLDCRQCHALDRSAPQQDHNAQGIGLLEVKDRLRYDFYSRWILDPLRLDPGTKMPKFAIDGQTTTIKHIYDGQARPQFDALWQYVQSLEPTQERASSPSPATSH